MAKPHQSRAGEVHERWTLLELKFIDHVSHPHYLCRCTCGTEAIVNWYNVKQGKSKSCGCLAREVTAATKRTHGASRPGGKWPEYRVWSAMIERCNNPRNRSYVNYGGRGISVCTRWLDFSNFIVDMGRRPSPELSIDRINNDGNYEPGNCRWATRLEQRANRRDSR